MGPVWSAVLGALWIEESALTLKGCLKHLSRPRLASGRPTASLQCTWATPAQLKECRSDRQFGLAALRRVLALQNSPKIHLVMTCMGDLLAICRPLLG